MKLMTFSLRLIPLVLVVGLFSCRKKDTDAAPQPMTLESAFSSGMDGWELGFSDYPANLSLSDSTLLYGFAHGWSPMPPSILPVRPGIRMRSINRSDDLFMYIRKKVSGLAENKDYRISIEMDIASNAPTNAVGVGGAPGEGVKVKAGASAMQPQSVRDANGWYRMNIDKGNQATGGADMVVVGHIGVTDTTRVHAIIKRSTVTPIVRRSNAAGELWLIVGTDSGFEGITELWWARVKAVLEPQ